QKVPPLASRAGTRCIPHTTTSRCEQRPLPESSVPNRLRSVVSSSSGYSFAPSVRGPFPSNPVKTFLLTSKNVEPAPVPVLHFACHSRQTFHCPRASPATPRTTILPETASENRCLLLPRTRPFPTAPRVPAFVRTRRSVSH